MYRNVTTEMSPDQNGQTEKSRTQPTNCVSWVTRSVELMTCTTQAGFILQVYFTLVIRSFSHISHTEGGQPKREEMHQVTGRPAQRILLSVFWLEKILPVGSIGGLQFVTRLLNSTTRAAIGKDWSSA